MARNKSLIWTIIERSLMIIGVIVVASAIVKAVDRGQGGRIAGVDEEYGACGPGMVSVSFSGGDFCIDKYEASAGVDCPYSSPGSPQATQENIDSRDCGPESAAGAVPWRFASQNQAAIICAKAGKRLPTNKEWQAASLGTPDKAGSWDINDCQVGGNWSDQPGLTGSGNRCVSAAGAYDMIGNVWEWVEETVYEGEVNGRVLPDSGYVSGIDDQSLPVETDFDESDPEYYNDYSWLKKTKTRAIARGGYWDNQAEAGQYSFYMVTPPSEAGQGIGFRCVK